MKTAIKPDFFSSQMTPISKVQEKSDASDEEKHLYSLANHAGWSIFKEGLLGDLAELESLNEQAIDNGQSLEQLGYNSIVLNQVKRIIKRALLRVGDAVESVENGKQ